MTARSGGVAVPGNGSELDPAVRVKQLERELALVHALDAARDASRGVTDLLRRCAVIVCAAVEAEECSVWLSGEDGEALRLACRERSTEERRTRRRSARRSAGRDAAAGGGAGVGGTTAGSWTVEGAARAALDANEVQTGEDAEGAYWLISPLLMLGRKLGALAVMDREAPFDDAEQRLIASAVGQADSALAHAIDHHELVRRGRELDAIRRIDRIRDGREPFEQKLDRICRVMSELLGAEAGFVMLFDLEGRELEMRASTRRGLSDDPAFRQTVQRLSLETLERGRLHRQEDLPAPWHGFIGVPLVLRDEVIGVFGAVRGAHHRAFDLEDEVILADVASQADTAVFENLEKLRVRQVFGRYVHPHVVDQLLAHGTNPLAPTRQVLTVLFSDIRGFTAMSEVRDPQFVVELLDEHLDAMAEVVMAGGGTVDKFVGDEVMAILGAPLAMPDHAVRAVEIAKRMQARQRELISVWSARGWPPLHIGIGINTGPMMVGNIGSERMSNYTVIGAAVNLGARLCGAAEGDQILVSEATAELVRDAVPLRKLPPLSLKGIAEPIPVWEVTDTFV